MIYICGMVVYWWYIMDELLLIYILDLDFDDYSDEFIDEGVINLTGVDTTLLLPGMYSAVFFADGTGQSAPAEPMEEISDIENGNPRYTVYQITDEDKQMLDIGTIPTFQKKINGAGGWVAITDIREIQYPGGRLVVNTPLNSDDTVSMATGKYLVKQQVQCAISTKITEKNIMKDNTCMGSLIKKNVPTIEDNSVSLDIFLNKMCAQLVANDLTLTHYVGGTPGNSITYVVTKGAETAPLSISVTGNAIAVVLATTGATITTTNQVLRTAINANPAIKRLGVIADVDKDDEASLATVFSIDTLVGGLENIDYSAKKDDLIIMQIYAHETDNIRWEMYGYISSIDSSPAPEEIVKQSLTLSVYGKIYYRPR